MQKVTLQPPRGVIYVSLYQIKFTHSLFAVFNSLLSRQKKTPFTPVGQNSKRHSGMVCILKKLLLSPVASPNIFNLYDTEYFPCGLVEQGIIDT